jgi:hypothetical protein
LSSRLSQSDVRRCPGRRRSPTVSRRRIWIEAPRRRFGSFTELSAWLGARRRALTVFGARVLTYALDRKSPGLPGVNFEAVDAQREQISSE